VYTVYPDNLGFLVKEAHVSANPSQKKLDLDDLPVDVFELSAQGLTVESLTVVAEGELDLCICPCSCACSGCSSSVLCSVDGA
jgi:hypothetical protein